MVGYPNHTRVQVIMVVKRGDGIDARQFMTVRRHRERLRGPCRFPPEFTKSSDMRGNDPFATWLSRLSIWSRMNLAKQRVANEDDDE